MSLELKREFGSTLPASGAPSYALNGVFGRSVNLEEFIVLWLDANHVNSENNTSDERLEELTNLRYIVNYLKIFKDAENCIELIEEYNTENIFLIVSGSYSEEVIPRIHDLLQVAHIYIFCLDMEKYVRLRSTSKYTKIEHRIFIEHTQLATCLKQDIFNSTQQLSTLDKSLRSPDDDPGAFIWFHLLIRSLILSKPDATLHIEKTAKAKTDMLEQCRSYYQDNPATLLQIDEFERTYEATQAIRWYTRDSFIYRILNRALRTEHIDVIFIFRFFLVDLHQHISDLHTAYREQLQNVGQSKITVYRGQLLNIAEFTRLSEMQGQVLAMNSFISTTLDRTVAEMYAGDGSKRPIGEESVIFQIEIDIQQCNKPFADIENYSYFNDKGEILLSPGLLVRINTIEESNRIWIISLCAAHEIVAPLEQLYQFYEEDDFTECKFVNLLRAMGDSHRAEMYQRTLHLEYSGSIRKYEAKLISEERFDEIDAENYFKISYNICCGSPDHSTLTPNGKLFSYAESTGNWLLLAHLVLEKGKEMYLNSGDFQIALSLLEQSLHIQLNKTQDDPSNTGIPLYLMTDTLFFIALTAKELGDHAKCLKHMIEMLNIDLECLPESHPCLISSYTHVGQAFACMKMHTNALEHMLRAVELHKLYLPDNGPKLATICIHIAKIFKEQSDYKNARHWTDQSLEILRTPSSFYSTKRAGTYHLTALTLRSLTDDSEQALTMLATDIHISRSQRDPLNYTTNAETYYIAARMQYEKTNFSMARSYLNKALSVKRLTAVETLPNFQSSAFRLYGHCYRDDKNRSINNALIKYRCAITCALQETPDDTPWISEILHHITQIYLDEVRTNDEEQNAWACYTVAIDVIQRAYDENDRRLIQLYYDIGKTCALKYQKQQGIPLLLFDRNFCFEQGTAYLEKAVRIHEINGLANDKIIVAVHKELGDLYYQQHAYSRALMNYEQTVEKSRNSGTLGTHLLDSNSVVAIHTRIGILMERKNNFPEAIHSWMQAMEYQIQKDEGQKASLHQLTSLLANVSESYSQYNSEDVAFF